MGVRVTRVWDEERVLAGRRARVFGYEYATLRGHVEMGRMDYEVYKWRDDGAVEFRLHAHSRPSSDGAPWVRLGFRLFGRREQVRFYRRCCERMARLTARGARAARGVAAARCPLRGADAPDTAELSERLLPRRTPCGSGTSTPVCCATSILLGEHRELHAVWSAPDPNDKTGYAHHPETLRLRGRLAALDARHEAQIAETDRRGFRHASPLDRHPATGGARQTELVDSLEDQSARLAAKSCECRG